MHNWAGNHIYSAVRVHHPDSLDALRGIVRRSSKLRALGTRHSFNAIADCMEDLVCLEHFNKLLTLDEKHVTVEPGIRYGDLGEPPFAVTAGPSPTSPAPLTHLRRRVHHDRHARLGPFAGQLFATPVTAMECLLASGELRQFCANAIRKFLMPCR